MFELIRNPISVDILAEINDIVAFAKIFERFGTRISDITYDKFFLPVVELFIDFFDVDSPAAVVAAEALIAVNTEVNMINFVATAELTVGKFCEGFMIYDNDDIETFVANNFECICMDTFELTTDENGYGSCACASGETNVDGVCVKAFVKNR